MSNDSLGNRMKNYENVSRYYLTQRTPVLLRLDGRAFHTFTRNFDKPFDEVLIKSMVEAACAVARDMQGFKLGYIQSDEASFLITDYDNVDTQGWFDYNLSKMISLSASVMTANFNEQIRDRTMGQRNTIATFDSRAFNVPEMDIANYFLWRSKDWSRNSLQMYARAFFSHKQLDNKRREDMHEMLYSIGKNWATGISPQKRNGTFIRKNDVGIEMLRYLR
jgi:tRNA(His) 5'-end guanylyltransferase